MERQPSSVGHGTETGTGWAPYTRSVAEFFTTACPSNPPAAAIYGRGRGSAAIGHSLATVGRGLDIVAIPFDPGIQNG